MHEERSYPDRTVETYWPVPRASPAVGFLGLRIDATSGYADRKLEASEPLRTGCLRPARQGISHS